MDTTKRHKNNLISAFDQFFQAPERTVPPGYFSAAELAKNYGLGASQMRAKLNALVDSGGADVKRLLVGRIWTSFYRVKPKVGK